MSHIILCFVLVLLTACARQVPHQSSVVNIEPVVQPLVTVTEAEWEQAVKRAGAFRLRDQELERIRATGQPRLLAGAAMQMPKDDDRGMSLLRAALTLDPAMELLHIALIDRHLARLSSRRVVSQENEILRSAIEQFRRQAPDNALAHYLWAWQLFRDDQVRSSIEALKAGNAAPRFSSSFHESFLAIRDVAQRVNYSRLEALIVAMQSLNPVFVYGAVRTLCKALAAETENSASQRQCYAVGRRIEAASRNVLETLVGLAIQRVAAKTGAWPEASRSVARIAARRDALLSLSDRFHTLDWSRALWLRYVAVFVTQSEEAAMRFILREAESTP